MTGAAPREGEAEAVLALLREQAKLIPEPGENEPFALGFAAAISVVEFYVAEEIPDRPGKDEAEAQVIAAARDLLTALDKGILCNVCLGFSPSWDGHMQQPPCQVAARENLRAFLSEVSS